jgi:hypothetical protein
MDGRAARGAALTHRQASGNFTDMKTTTKKSKRLTVTQQMAADALAPLAAYVARTRGAASIVQERLTAAIGEDQHLKNISQWLSADPRQHREPRAGVLLLLLELRREIEDTGGLADYKRFAAGSVPSGQKSDRNGAAKLRKKVSK